jgi:hypothetical protein
MRFISFVVGLAAVVAPVMAGAAAPADPAATQQIATYSTSTTALGVLIADPATRAVLVKHIPQLVEKSDIAERASGMTLKEMQEALRAYSPDLLSDEVLAKIDVDLAALPAQ